MQERSIQAVTFDLWNTLIVDTPEGGRNRAAKRIDATFEALDRSGLGYSRDHIANVYWKSQAGFEEVRRQGLDTPFAEQMDIYFNLIESGLSDRLQSSVKERITADHADAYLVDPPALMPDALETLETISGRGYVIALICNSGATPGSHQRQYLSDLGVAKYMETLTFSDEERLAKPSAQIFHTTLDAIGVPAGAALHIGDRPETDILGAKSVGMRAVLIGGASPGRCARNPGRPGGDAEGAARRAGAYRLADIGFRDHPPGPLPGQEGGRKRDSF